MTDATGRRFQVDVACTACGTIQTSTVSGFAAAQEEAARMRGSHSCALGVDHARTRIQEVSEVDSQTTLTGIRKGACDD